MELDDEDDDDRLEEELEDGLLLELEPVEDELELDGKPDDELDEGVGPATVPLVQPWSIPTPASASPPESILRNSLRSSRRFCCTLTPEESFSTI